MPASPNTQSTDANPRPVDELLVLPDGRILSAGSFPAELIAHPQEAGGVVLIRLTFDGALDTTFNDVGIADYRMDHDPFLRDLLLLPDGDVIVTSGANAFVSALRLNGDGTADTGFGDVAGRIDLFQAGVVTTGGDFLAVGNASLSRLRITDDGQASPVWLGDDGTLAVGRLEVTARPLMREECGPRWDGSPPS